MAFRFLSARGRRREARLPGSSEAALGELLKPGLEPRGMPQLLLLAEELAEPHPSQAGGLADAFTPESAAVPALQAEGVRAEPMRSAMCHAGLGHAGFRALISLAALTGPAI